MTIIQAVVSRKRCNGVSSDDYMTRKRRKREPDLGFRDRLLQAMAAQRFRPIDLARRFGTTKNTVNSWKNGYPPTDLARQEKLARVLSVSLNWLIPGSGPPNGEVAVPGPSLHLVEEGEATGGTLVDQRDETRFQQLLRLLREANRLPERHCLHQGGDRMS